MQHASERREYFQRCQCSHAKTYISISDSLQNNAMDSFGSFWGPYWYMGPIEGAYNLRESAHVLKFQYGLSSSASVFKNLVLSKATQNSSVIFMAEQRPIPNVNPTALYEFPGACL